MRFEPKSDKRFSGYVEMDFLNFDERLRCTEEVLELRESGGPTAQIKIARIAIGAAKQAITKTCIKKGERQYKDFDELITDPSAMNLATEIGQYLLLGDQDTEKGNAEKPQ